MLNGVVGQVWFIKMGGRLIPQSDRLYLQTESEYRKMIYKNL